jgi:hypothetical protein
MGMGESGFFWHVHHDVLLEWSDNIAERIEYIKDMKPEDEVELRLKLLRRVKGELPEEIIKARNAFEKALDAFDKTWNACDDVWDTYDKAWKVFYKTWKNYDKAIVDHLPEIELLHKQECKNCPWDGHTIFPE